jgi:glycyl-tRNA synthetase beta chain
LQGIVALLDGAVVDCEVGGIVAGRATMGHRFHSSGAIAIESAETYADQLRAAHVLVDHEERRDRAHRRAEAAAAPG